jgi:hypothetical protein
MQYNAKTVLRLIPNVTLARLFAPYSVFEDFDWDAGSKGSADRIFECWQTMEDGEVRAIGRVLGQVHCLATPRGTRALIEAGRDQGPLRFDHRLTSARILSPAQCSSMLPQD